MLHTPTLNPAAPRHAPFRPTAPARLSALLGTLLLAGLTGCTTAPPSGPDRGGEPAVPVAFRQQAPAGAATPAAVPDPWWTLYGDPVLDDLQHRLVLGNENLKAALAQVASARALLGGSRAAQAPSLSASLGATRADTSTAAGVGAATSYSVGATAAWELDLWGRLSQASEASQARLQASEADLAAVRLSAQATLTQTYFALRNAEAQQAVLARSVQAYERSLALTEARQQAGVAVQTDVLQARTQLRTAQVQALEQASQRAQYEHALAVLLGLPPSALTLAVQAPEARSPLPTPPTVPALLPGELLQRRPDIRAAERRLAAAWAALGAADAAFFPSFTLSATTNAREARLAELFNGPSLLWSLGASVTQKLLDGGALRAASDQARASADQAAASYRQTVLTAWQEVEDNLLLAQRLGTEVGHQQEALDNARRNLAITEAQYRAGTVSYLNVVTAQTTALASERTLLDLRARHINATSQLLKNLAGRW